MRLKRTLGYVNQNIVAEYLYESLVIDGVNVDYEVLRSRTEKRAGKLTMMSACTA